MRFASVGRRCLGAVLLGLILLPWYRLVELRAAGPAVEQTLRLGSLYLVNVWAGLVLAAVSAIVLGWLIRPGVLIPLWSRARELLLAPTPARFGAGLGLLAAAVSLCVGALVLDGNPALLDGISQLVQARYFSAGMLSGPPLEHPEFWHFQFMVLADSGWASQYPPGFPALLAIGWSLGLAWLVGPVMLGFTVYLTSLIADRLFPADPIVARIGVLLTALSPFLAFHAAAYMNHVLAAALVAAAVFASLRAADGRWRWSLLAGAAVGGLFATRPYTGLILGFFAVVVVWLWTPERLGFRGAGWANHLAGVMTGAGPFVIGVLVYNARVFGGATRFGYVAAEGPGHGLGFHVDPWGNPYGLPEAVGYTSADLLGMSLDLLQTPIASVALVALFLLFAPRLTRGAGVAAAWALLPVGANLFYWHHDLFMGPRLLYEAAPGWCLLLSAAGAWLVRSLPEQGRWRLTRWLAPRDAVTAVFALALLVAVAYSGPGKLASYGATAARSGMNIQAPTPDGASLVFVHGSWEDRLGARLSAVGMRTDSVRLALHHNATCRLELYLEGVEAGVRKGVPGETAGSALAFQQATGPALREFRMPSGSVIRSYENERLEPLCERQAASDFDGVLGLPPLLWQGDLPGLEAGGAMFVRDLGPERNARLLDRFPDREPTVLVRRGGEVRLVAYDRGMADLWPSD